MESDMTEYEQNGIDITFIKPMKKESIDKLLEYCLLSGCQSRHNSSHNLSQVIIEILSENNLISSSWIDCRREWHQTIFFFLLIFKLRSS